MGGGCGATRFSFLQKAFWCSDHPRGRCLACVDYWQSDLRKEQYPPDNMALRMYCTPDYLGFFLAPPRPVDFAPGAPRPRFAAGALVATGSSSSLRIMTSGGSFLFPARTGGPGAAAEVDAAGGESPRTISCVATLRFAAGSYLGGPFETPSVLR